MKKILILLISLTTLTLNSKEYTNYSVFGNIDLDYNIHNTSINGFSGVENCCDEFSGNNYIEPSFGLGLEYKLGDWLFDKPTNYVLTLKMNGLSSEFSETRHRGFLIDNNEMDSVFVEHRLNPSVKLFNISNSLYLFPTNDISVGLGFVAGFPISSTFSQKDVAVSPDDYVFENGQREINNADGENIEEINSVILSLNFGVRYDLLEVDDFTIRPELNYSYYPMSLIEGGQWNATKMSAAVSLVYKFPAEAYTPEEPPKPRMPEPPKEEPKVEDVEAKVFIYENVENGDEIPDNSTEIMDIEIVEYVQEYSLKPVVFFDKGEVAYKKYNIRNFTGVEFDVQTKLIESIAQKMKDDPELRVTLNSYDLKDEPNSIIKARLNTIENELLKQGIAKDRIVKVTKDVQKEFNYPELKEEYRKVELVLSDGSDIISSTYEIDEEINVSELSYRPYTSIKPANVSEEAFKISSLKIGDNNAKEGRNDFNFTFGKETVRRLLKDGELPITYETYVELDGKKSTDKRSFTIKPNVNRVTKDNNIIKEDGSEKEQYILAYTDFDESKLHSVNDKVLTKVKDALNKNKSVTIYASTDNLGDPEYNKKLANRRAEAAKELIGGEHNNLILKTPDEFLFSNEHPYGRMLNRAIVVRIE